MKSSYFILFCKFLGFNIFLYLVVSFVYWDIFIIKEIAKITYGERAIIASWVLCLNYIFYIFRKIDY